jgi:hypothetical protein
VVRTFQIPVTFDSANRRRDKSVRLAFTTNLEIPTDEYMIMDGLIQNTGWLVWSSNELQPSDIPDVPADEAFGKFTPSQETRWLLKKLYEQHPQDVEWADYYRSRMAAINNELKARLDQ